MAALPIEKLDALETRFRNIEAEMSSGPSAEDYVRLSKEYAELQPMVMPIVAYRKAVGDLAAAEELANSGDREMAEMASAEIGELKPKIAENKVKIGAAATVFAVLAAGVVAARASSSDS